MTARPSPLPGRLSRASPRGKSPATSGPLPATALTTPDFSPSREPRDPAAGAGDLLLKEVDPTGPEASWCLTQYFHELESRFDEGFSPERSLEADASVFRPPSGAFLLGTVDGRPMACGALKLMEGRVGYIKRMWVDDWLRGRGMGRRLLSALEAVAARYGCTSVQLETHRALEEARALYRSAGYEVCEPFNDEVYAHHWFRKTLAPEGDR